jgi:hypothetical protein
MSGGCARPSPTCGPTARAGGSPGGRRWPPDTRRRATTTWRPCYGKTGHIALSFGGNYSALTGLTGAVDTAVVAGGPVKDSFTGRADTEVHLIPGTGHVASSKLATVMPMMIGWLRRQLTGQAGPLLLASYLPHVADAVVASSPTDIIQGATSGTGPGWTLDGKALPTGTLIPVNKIRVPLLMGDGGQDAVWNSAGSARAIVTELDSSPGHAPVTNLYYPAPGTTTSACSRATRCSPT